MASAEAAAVAFIALVDTLHDDPDAQHVVDVTTDVLEVFKRSELDPETSNAVLKAALSLLQRKQSIAIQVQLLQLVRVLKTHMQDWSVEVCFDVVSVLALLLLSVEAAGIPTIDALASLISEILVSYQEVQGAVVIAVVQWATTPRAVAYRSLSAQQLSNWSFRTDFEDVATMLRDGSRFEQDTALKCLLVNGRCVRERFVVGSEGTEVILNVIEHGSALAKALALAFAKDAAIYLRTFRKQVYHRWQYQQQELLALAHNPESAVIITDEDIWDDAVLLRDLQSGEVYQQVVHLAEMTDNGKLARRLSHFSNLLEVLALLISNRMMNTDVSVADLDVTSWLWIVLLRLVNHPRPLKATADVLNGAQAIAKLAGDILSAAKRTPRWTLNALKVLCSPLLRTNGVRDVLVDSGAISSLVKLLANQESDVALGRDLIVLLRELAKANTMFAYEIEQCGLILCSYNHDGERFLSDDEPRLYYHNLLLLYRDIPEMRLGQTADVNKAINALVVAEQLSSHDGNDIEKLFMVHFLHNELGLNGLDPVRCDLDDFATSNVVVGAVAGILDAFIYMVLYGSADGRKVARRVLTVIARIDSVSRKKLQEYHSDPSRPALVVSEALGTEADTELANGAQDGEGDEEYEYSDDEGENDEEDGEDADESDQEATAQLKEASACEMPDTVNLDIFNAAPQGSSVVQAALAGLSMNDDDWELI